MNKTSNYIILSVIACIFFISCTSTVDNKKHSNSLKADITDFLLDGKPVNTSTIEIAGINIDKAKQLQYKAYSTAERLLFSVSFSPIIDNPIIRIGREMGGVMEINDTLVTIYQLNNKLNDYEVYETKVLPFELLAGNSYNIACEKLNEKVLVFSLTSADNYFEIKYDRTSLTSDKRRIALGWGIPFFGVVNGSVKITDAVISSKYSQNTKLSIWGDSFIEGVSMTDFGMENRWCALLAEQIGSDNCPIIGKGGERIDQDFITRFKIENNWFKTPYVIISLGTNNGNVLEYKKYMQQCVDYLKSKGQIPILVTVTPRPEFDYTSVTKEINDWVKQSGEIYIDMHKAVTESNNPAQWKNGFVQTDNVHPTIAGHAAMFRQIKIDCPFLLYL